MSATVDQAPPAASTVDAMASPASNAAASASAPASAHTDATIAAASLRADATAQRGAAKPDPTSATTVVPTAPPATTAATSTTAKPSQIEQAAAAKLATVRDAQARNAATTQQGSSPIGKAPSPAGAIGGAVFALLVVVAFILVLAWLAKRMPGVRSASHAGLRVVGSLALGPRERVVVVAVGDTQLLLGVGPGGTRTLHTLQQPLPDVAAPAPFAQLLAQPFGKKP